MAGGISGEVTPALPPTDPIDTHDTHDTHDTTATHDTTGTADSTEATEPRGTTRRWRRGRSLPIVLAVLVLLVVAIAFAAWTVVAVTAVQRHANAAAHDVGQVRTTLEQADLPGAVDGTRAAAREAAAAADAAKAFPLRVAAHLPAQLGGTVTAIQQLASATDLALGRGALPLITAAARVEDTDALIRPDGSIDVAALSAQSASVQPAATALAQARRQADAVRVADVPGRVRPSVRTAQKGIDELATKTGAAAATLAVLPPVLGADGPRNYLVVFQNTAELRPAGGIAGTWALISVNDGHVTLTDDGTADDLSRLSGPVRDLGPDFRANYPQDKVAVAQDANLSPHFPYAAQLYADLWTSLGRPAPDGVIAVDPSGMASLLAGHGDVSVPGGPSINSSTVVDVMLRQVYVDFASDTTARRAYLSEVIGLTFSKALSGKAFTPTTARSLVAAVRGDHVLAWSAHPAEQEDLVRAGIAGQLPEPTRGSAGVFLTNTSGVYAADVPTSRLDYYLHESVTTSGGCEGAPASMKVVLRNDAPETVPDYVANHVPGLPATTESLLVAVYVPPSRGVAFITVNGTKVPFATGSERGWTLARFGVTLPRATDMVVQVAFSGAAAPVSTVLTQPMVNTPTVQPTTCGRS